MYIILSFLAVFAYFFQVAEKVPKSLAKKVREVAVFDELGVIWALFFQVMLQVTFCDFAAKRRDFLLTWGYSKLLPSLKI